MGKAQHSLFEKLREVSGDLEPWDRCPQCQFQELSTPAHDFFRLFRVVGDRLVFVGSRDGFDNELAAFLMKKASEFAETFDPSRRRIGVYRIPFPAQVCFDSLVLLGAEAHNAYEHFDSYLNDHTIVVFPAYHCEFVGNESAGEIDYIRRNIVETLVWERDPSPKCKIYYENRRTGIELRGNRLLLATAEEAIEQIENLDKAPGPASFLDIQNFQDAKAHLEWSTDGFVSRVEDGQTLTGLSLEEMKAWALQFLYQDCQRYIKSER